jgi:hypothetical protein
LVAEWVFISRRPDEFVKKVAQNAAQPKCCRSFFCGKKSLKSVAFSVTFSIKLPKVKKHPMGENSPNLVALLANILVFSEKNSFE